MYEAALTKKHAATPASASTTPPDAGPTTREALMITSYSPTALATRPRPTRPTTYNWRAGAAKAETHPFANAGAKTNQDRTAPVTPSTPTPAATAPPAPP